MNKSQLTKFTAKLELLLQNNTFVSNGAEYSYNWQKVTKYGLLLVNSKFNDVGCKAYSITCRFEEPKKAKIILESWAGNTYSGKCNFHEFDEDYALEQFEMFLKEL